MHFRSLKKYLLRAKKKCILEPKNLSIPVSSLPRTPPLGCKDQVSVAAQENVRRGAVVALSKMGGHGAAAARKGWREIDDPETKDEVRSLFLKRGIQRGTYDPRRGGMG